MELMANCSQKMKEATESAVAQRFGDICGDPSVTDRLIQGQRGLVGIVDLF